MNAEGELTKGKPTLPGDTCQTEPLDKWTPQEKWVWKQLCEGKIADFNESNVYGDILVSKAHDEWPESRILTPEFLETILLHEPYRGTLTHQGVQIKGAWFREPINLSYSTLEHQLWLDASYFGKDVVLEGLKTDYPISLENSEFNGLVDLRNAKIGSQINMNGSKFTGKLNMNGMEVGSSLLMRGGAGFNEVDLIGAKVGGQINMNGSKFTGKLNMDLMKVGSSLLMRGGAEFNEVRLSSAKVGGSIALYPSTFKSIDLSEANIHEEFILAAGYNYAAKWRNNSSMILLNTKIGILEDSRDSWPENLVLEGFVYDQLGKFYTDEVKETETRDITWLKEWLNKQKKYSPQPYEQLASVLRKSGHVSMAHSILYAGRERKRKETATGLNWFGLTILKYVIGYGYGYRIFNSFIWVIFFGGIGTILLRINKEGKKRNIGWCIFYSLDLILPIIKLDERHYKIELEGFARYYYYFHIVIGFILASFVAAGISGLIQ